MVSLDSHISQYVVVCEKQRAEVMFQNFSIHGEKMRRWQFFFWHLVLLLFFIYYAFSDNDELMLLFLILCTLKKKIGPILAASERSHVTIQFSTTYCLCELMLNGNIHKSRNDLCRGEKWLSQPKHPTPPPYRRTHTHTHTPLPGAPWTCSCLGKLSPLYSLCSAPSVNKTFSF